MSGPPQHHQHWLSLTSPLRHPHTFPMARDLMSSPQGHQPLPQRCCSRAGLHFSAVQPCPDVDHTKPGVTMGLCPHSQAGADAQSRSCPWVPTTVLLLFGVMDQVLAVWITWCKRLLSASDKFSSVWVEVKAFSPRQASWLGENALVADAGYQEAGCVKHLFSLFSRVSSE